MQFIDLNTQLSQMRLNIDRRIKNVLDHGQFIMGPEVQELEQALADYTSVDNCISCANGTDALQLALMALQVGPGDIVFTTAFSFFATAEVIPLVGATPYFVDIDLATYNLSPDCLEQAICDAKSRNLGRPKAVIAADMFGLPADYIRLQEICDKHDLYLIEDGAQSFGGAIGEHKTASFGHIATTSFFPAKPLGCFGDGGAIFTHDEQLAQLCRSMRVHGKGAHKYQNVRVGLNSRLDTIQAAILLEKLTKLDDERTKKNELALRYNSIVDSTRFVSPTVVANMTSAWAQYTLLCIDDERDDVQQKLKEKGVPTMVYYPLPLTEQEPFKQSFSTATPNTQQACERVFSLPMHGYLNEQDWSRIEQAIESL